jgi:hypothetical protein
VSPTGKELAVSKGAAGACDPALAAALRIVPA